MKELSHKFLTSESSSPLRNLNEKYLSQIFQVTSISKSLFSRQEPNRTQDEKLTKAYLYSVTKSFPKIYT